mmetsp:Transcript_18861/g.75232  ORF Transcript_18861/g.75232 Transcript_18861/m.75232 type:complete len:316 (-) Transcript_18861:285-1232(-)
MSFFLDSANSALSSLRSLCSRSNWATRVSTAAPVSSTLRIHLASSSVTRPSSRCRLISARRACCGDGLGLPDDAARLVVVVFFGVPVLRCLWLDAPQGAGCAVVVVLIAAAAAVLAFLGVVGLLGGTSVLARSRAASSFGCRGRLRADPSLFLGRFWRGVPDCESPTTVSSPKTSSLSSSLVVSSSSPPAGDAVVVFFAEQVSCLSSSGGGSPSIACCGGAVAAEMSGGTEGDKEAAATTCKDCCSMRRSVGVRSRGALGSTAHNGTCTLASLSPWFCETRTTTVSRASSTASTDLQGGSEVVQLVTQIKQRTRG